MKATTKTQAGGGIMEVWSEWYALFALGWGIQAGVRFTNSDTGDVIQSIAVIVKHGEPSAALAFLAPERAPIIRCGDPLLVPDWAEVLRKNLRQTS